MGEDVAVQNGALAQLLGLGSEDLAEPAQGGAQIAESYAEVAEGELWLVNGYIAPYEQAKTFTHEERRRRKLLASRKQLADLWNATQRKGMTLVPLVLYFNDRGIAKLKIGIARGKKTADKRAASRLALR